MISFLTFIASLIYSRDFLLFLTISTLATILIILPTIFLYLRNKFERNRLKNTNRNKLQIGIFHPYCNAGGGGEKVLWVAIQALQQQYEDAEFAVYTGDIEATPQEILKKVEDNLNVTLNRDNIKFIYLTTRKWIESEQYPYFTLLGQAIGSIWLGYEAIKKFTPDIYIETTGFTFTLPLFKYLARCRIGCYVHYPIITHSMIRRVHQRRTIYNNRNIIARSPVFTHMKLVYYRIFAWLYSVAGQCADITLVNSTYTLEHLQLLWHQRNLHLVYPPCDVADLKCIERGHARTNDIRILSISQFRPEKDHPLQIQTLYELREILPNDLFDLLNIKLILCGSCRNQADYDRVKDLKDLSKHLSLENHVEFKLNLTYHDLLMEYQHAYIGIHTMLDEHFGIGVVELMAAGLIVVAHRSGGPLLDIIETQEGSRLGYLAVTPEEYASIIKFILMMDDDQVNEIREKARASVDRFSTKKFQQEFLRAVQPLFKF